MSYDREDKFSIGLSTVVSIGLTIHTSLLGLPLLEMVDSDLVLSFTEHILTE